MRQIEKKSKFCDDRICFGIGNVEWKSLTCDFHIKEKYNDFHKYMRNAFGTLLWIEKLCEIAPISQSIVTNSAKTTEDPCNAKFNSNFFLIFDKKTEV